jgi:hypothetical protein
MQNNTLKRSAENLIEPNAKRSRLAAPKDNILHEDDDLTPSGPIIDETSNDQLEDLCGVNEIDWNGVVPQNISKHKMINPMVWHSATSVSNYMLDDPICDWIKMYNNGTTTNRYSHLTNQKSFRMNNTSMVIPGVDLRETDFFNFLTTKGCNFEESVIKYIQDRIKCNLQDKKGPELFVKIVNSPYEIMTQEAYDETLAQMNKGTPFIYQGVVRNPQNKTYGSPDLLVRRDYLNFLSKQTLDLPDNRPSPNLKAPGSKYPARYHYVVVDIKFMTLRVRADGEHLLNSGRNKCIKGQLMIYNMALGYMQGYTPPKCYVLGRGYYYKSCDEVYRGSRCDDMLAAIDCNDLDAPYLLKISNALKWREDLVRDGAKYKILPVPTRKELYPNMCNHYDSPFHKIKQDYAEKLDEITMLWQCGVKHRENCHNAGITKWTDPECTIENLKMTGPLRTEILSRMLDFNHGKLGDAKVIPQYIHNNWSNWRGTTTLEFFIDFENVTNVSDTMQNIPYITGENIVFMIGLYYIEPTTGTPKYHSFVSKTLDRNGEFEIFNRFHLLIENLCAKFECDDPNFFHWGQVEQTLYESTVAKYEEKVIRQNLIWTPPKFVDFLKIIKDELILVRGALNFSLKTYAKALKDLNLIDLEYDTTSCSSGLEALVDAINCYKTLPKNALPQTSPIMQKIIKYNKVDCQMIFEIVNYLRKNHSYKGMVNGVITSFKQFVSSFYMPWWIRARIEPASSSTNSIND